ncbi:MAG: S10 family peptidase [Rubrivivax sp.]|uniref:S10 family peptidase n=1 Tax=Roseateles sp. TaxID=1971397 RepID=UPI00391DA59E
MTLLNMGFKGLLSIALALFALLASPAQAAGAKFPAYNAKAGMLKIGKDPERPDAEIFHVAYTLKDAELSRRPVTFVLNGGPGGASIYLHLSAIGPKVIVTPGDGSFPAVPARLEENPDSWLRFTDLVFIDPVGTGYSRMLPGPDGKPADPRPYYAVESDVHSIAVFIQQWLTVNKRWGSPKGIAGESYAGRRIAALVPVLARQYGINLNRAVLISPAMSVPSLIEPFPAYDLLHAMTLLPTQAATAAHHGLSTITNDAAGHKQAEDFALSGYLTGLASLGRMSPQEQAAFYARVGGLIGLDPALVALHRGRVGEAVFATSLLAARGKVLDLYDGTQPSDNPKPEVRDGFGAMPRTLEVFSGVLLPPFMDYVRQDLGYVTDRPYIVLNLEVAALWDRKSPMGSPEDLAVALAQNTDVRVLVVHGYQDQAANYFLSRYLLEQLVVMPSARERLSFRNYLGGHMFYLRAQSRAQLYKDVSRFYEAAP